ncbi:hypothetical protein HHK36_029497 [Tetracentron sinense]|uniref:Uncharacterized protein n=1 Tax=Tetracentron sinense TaxID=13715 RepID=A0A835CZS8_TETSI|nr:hypothetical protein HHK36_029497 [Tetracentron sinense]
MGRQPCCDKKIGLNRGSWTIEEDHKLMSFILNNGIHCWRIVPKLAGYPVIHNPIEHDHEYREGEGEQVSESNSSREQEKNLEVELNNPGSKDSHVALKEQGGYEFGSNETNCLLDNYDNWWESLDLGLMMNPETNPPNTCSSSFSLEDSLNPSMGESSFLQEDSLQQWVDTVDSILSWDGLHHLD